MKTLLLLAAAFVVTSSADVSAQTNEYAYSFNPKNFKVNVIEAMAKSADATDASSVSAKTLKNFEKNFHSATNAQWFQLKNKETMCRFIENGILNWAFYKESGALIISAKGYDESQIPKEIRKTVKSSYYDYNITYVQEVNMAGQETVYIVHLEDPKTVKVLWLKGDEMETIQDLNKTM